MVSFFDIRMKGVVMTVKDPLRFDGVDVKFTKAAGVGVAVVTALFAIVWPIVSWVRGEPLVVWFDGAAEGAAEGMVPGAAPGVTVTHGSRVFAEFAEASPGLWLASLVPPALFVIFLVFVLWLLWRLLDDVGDAHPFTMANVARMRGIAIVMMGGSVVLLFARGLANGYLASHAFVDESVLFAYDFEPSSLLLPGVGLLIAALAEAFKRGIQLESDVEGLV